MTKSSSELRAKAAEYERQADAQDRTAEKTDDCGCEVAGAVAGAVTRTVITAVIAGTTGVVIG